MNRGGLYYAAGRQRKRSCRRRGESGSEGFVAPGHQSVRAGQRIESTKGVENTLTAVIAHRDLAGFKVEWVRAGVVVSTDTTYTFKENQVGVFPITITASNEDGETKKELEIEVVENMPYKVVFLPRLMSSLFPHAIRLSGDRCSCVHCWTISRIRNTAGA